MNDEAPDDDFDGGNYYGDDGEALDGPDFHVIAGGLEPTPLDLALCKLPENDLGNAQRLARRNDGHLWWTKEWGAGAWDGRRFDFIQGEALVGKLAQETAERMRTHEIGAYRQSLPRRRDETSKQFEDRFRRFAGFCLQAGNNGRTEAMLKQAERRMTRPLSDFDADPDKLTVANGTLVLDRKACEVRFTPSHEPSDLITVCGLAAYDPDAKCPAFDAFLEKVQPDPAVRQFLQRVVGYCLTGHIGEQAYFIFQGKGGDGKSTFLSALEAALGGFVANASIDTFLHRDRKGSDHSADLARLASGVRLVKASEPEQGARLAESVLKVVTGGEPFPARAMFKPPFEFIARWKLIISCNRKPQIRGDDRGIWRRTVVVPWPVSIPKEEIDKGLVTAAGDGKLQAEASGILNWAIRGWEDWLERDGLDPPPAVVAAIDEYRLSSNPFGAWFDTCCDLDEGAREASADLYRSYKGWLHEIDQQPMSTTAFGRMLSDRTLIRIKSSGIKWGGVRLNAAGQEAARALQDAEDRRFGHPNAPPEDD